MVNFKSGSATGGLSDIIFLADPYGENFQFLYLFNECTADLSGVSHYFLEL